MPRRADLKEFFTIVTIRDLRLDEISGFAINLKQIAQYRFALVIHQPVPGLHVPLLQSTILFKGERPKPIKVRAMESKVVHLVWKLEVYFSKRVCELYIDQDTVTLNYRGG